MINRIDLNGWWQIKFDENDEGEALGWRSSPPQGCMSINLPACWNQVFPQYHAYDGTAWLFRQIYLPAGALNQRVLLRFEGVNYRCKAYVNGKEVGEHEGGFTPFAYNVTQNLLPEQVNTFAVRVNGEHDEWSLPPRGVDWFNYNGIYRPVYLETTCAAYIDDYTIQTKMSGAVSIIARLRNSSTAGNFTLAARLYDQAGQPTASWETPFELEARDSLTLSTKFQIAEPHLWNPGDGYLYRLELELFDAQQALCDRCQKRFGIREFAIEGDKILVNGREIKLVGASKHDEYPLTARTPSREQLAADYALLRRMNANFVRLCHYPHNRLEHELLNEMGLLAISELPLIFLHEAQMASPEVSRKAMRSLEEMIQAEKNETCILFWGLFTECDTHLPDSRPFIQAIVERARSLDNTRPLIMASTKPLEDTAYDLFDVIGVNYWEGWYRDAPLSQASEWLETLLERYPHKPLLITSHGWEGLYGEHSLEEKLRWSEEQQADYLAALADIFMGYKNLAGEIVWTFADFRVSEWEDAAHPTLHRKRYLERPMQINHKGLLDFYRRPKLAYHAMRQKFSQWSELTQAPRRYGENLQLRVYSTRRLMGCAAAFDLIDLLQKLLDHKASVRVLFASAASQLEFVDSLKRNRSSVDWRQVQAFHLDEYAGANAESTHGFAHWIQARLASHLPFGRFEALNGQAEDLEIECQRYAHLLSEAPIDIACIGIGENGHIAFNDPHAADFNDPLAVKIVSLDETCRWQQVRDGAFENIDAAPRRALTLTIPAIMQAENILCIAPAQSKAAAVWKTLHGEISPACPASILRRHPQARLYLDRESASLLEQ
ncbi:MAG: 6-phosphogluconolactonase [Anaerolineales bacterium]|nr:6-phosphogluconolactonase [Anaerolineales bacterium]